MASKRSSPWYVELAPAIGALIAFTGSIWSIALDRTATAAVAAMLMLLLLLIRHLPVIDSLELFTLKAKFGLRINEADALVADIRQIALVMSRATYLQLAYIGRWDGVPWDKKRKILTDLDNINLQLKIDPQLTEAAKRPILQMVAFDLLSIFEDALQHAAELKRREIENQIAQYRSESATYREDKAYCDLLEKRDAYTLSRLDLNTADDDLSDVESLARMRIKAIPLDGVDGAAIERLKDEISALASDCWLQHTATIPALEYIDRYQANPVMRFEELRFAQPLPSS